MTVVVGVAASHSTLMNTHWDEVVHVERAERFRAALGTARDAVAAARPDVVVVVGSNHFRGLWLDLMPTFALGVGEVIASGESGTPEGPLAVDPPFATDLLGALVAGGFDVAFSARLQVDHGITHAVQYVLDGIDVPVVPLVVNVFAPPLPTLGRCLALGDALGRHLRASGRRVGVVASGGLSHRLPWPDWRAPRTDDDRFMVEAWLEGRGTRWRDYEARRRAIVRAARPEVDRRFDGEVLAALEAGRLGELAGRAPDLAAGAGNGSQEVRTWLVAAAACGHPRGRVLAYEPLPEWLTGMGVALLTAEGVPA